MVTDTTRAAIDKLQSRALIIGIAGIALTFLGLLFGGPDLVVRPLLMGYVLCLGLLVGSLGFVLVRHMAGGTWMIVAQRLAEAGTRIWWFFAFAGALIILLGSSWLFPWLDPAHVEKYPIVAEKFEYLNLPFFTVRFFVYFAIWAGIAFLINSWSAKLETTRNQMYAVYLRRFSPVGVILLFATITFASTDWGMSLEPEWFSTIYGVHWLISGGLTTLCIIISALTLLENEPDFKHRVQTSHFHNLGNFLMAHTILWTYVSFAQFLIIWSGNVPEEIGYYMHRTSGLLVWVSVFLMVFHFVIPLNVLLYRKAKKHTSVLRKVCFYILAVRCVDIYWVIAPSFAEARGEQGALMAALYVVFTATAIAGMAGLTIFFYLNELKKRPLLPAFDPVAELYFSQEEEAHEHA